MTASGTYADADLGQRPALRTGAPRTALALAAIVAAQLVLRVWAMAGGWFYRDDFWWHDIVATTPLAKAAPLSLGGHFSPLTYIPYWLTTDAFPYDWTARVVVMAVTLLIIDGFVILLARQLWSADAPVIIVFGLFAASSLMAPSLLWYSQFSMLGALIMGTTATLWATIRAVRKPTFGRQSLAIAIFGLSLLAQERVIAFAWVPFAFCVLLMTSGPVRHAVVRVFHQARAMWLTWIGLSLGYLLVYRSVATPLDESGHLATPWEITSGFVHSALPALLGGPWVIDFEETLGQAAIAAVNWIAVAAFAGIVVISVRRDRWAGRAWVLLGLLVAIDLALVAAGRTILGVDAFLQWRFFSDLTVLAPVLLVAAFVRPQPVDGTRTSSDVPRALCILAALIAASGVLVTLRLGAAWHESPTRQFAQTAIEQLQAAPPGSVIANSNVPELVVPPILGVQRQSDKVFSIVDTEAVFDEPTEDLLIFDTDGRLVPAEIQGRVGQGPVCAAVLEQTTMPLPGPADLFSWGLQMSYSAEADTRAEISTDADRALVDLRQGKHTIFVPLTGPHTFVRIFPFRAPVCLDQVVVGSPVVR